MNKIKIFEKIESTYKLKRILWLNNDTHSILLKKALYYKGYFFLAGWKIQGIPTSPDAITIANLHIFKEENIKDPVKSIIIEKDVSANRQYDIDRFIVPFGEYVLYLKQSEKKLYFVSLKTLEVEKAVDLQMPEYYKSMPKDFYVRKDYQGNHQKYLMDLEYWATSYSAITKAVLYKSDYLVLQIRTCSGDKAKFALLFYNLKNNCSLDDVIFLNDLLLAERDGKLYCFKNGNPDLDEGVDTTEIIIYRIMD